MPQRKLTEMEKRAITAFTNAGKSPEWIYEYFLRQNRSTPLRRIQEYVRKLEQG